MNYINTSQGFLGRSGLVWRNQAVLVVMKISFNQIFGAALIFSLLCLFGYIHRGDTYHKQSDQFYYLSLADSLRISGELKERIDTDNKLPVTATSGAAFVLLPVSSMTMENAFLSVSIFYFLINILSL